MTQMAQITALLLLLFPRGAYADCGLSFCPVGSHRSEEAPGWRLSLQVRHAGFDVAGVSGHFTQATPRAEYRAARWWAGAGLPVTRLEAMDETRTALSNPILFAEGRPEWRRDWKPAFGLQIELPFGDHEHGIASEHAEFVPYASLVRSFGHPFLLATAGFRAAVGGHEHDAMHPLLVNPHEDKEFLYRLGGGSHWRHNALMVQGYLDGQRVLSDEEGEKGFLSAGLQAVGRLSDDFDMTGTVEVPVTTPSRVEWLLSLGVTYRR